MSATGAMSGASAQCMRAMEGVGAGIGASLRGVDCAASAMAQAAFNNLFANGAMGTTLTLALTLFVAFLGFGLITGRARLGLSALTPKMVTVGLVATFATSWVAFQSVFWNLAVGAPDFIATSIMGTDGSATTIFADKLDVVMLSLMEASGGDAMANDTSIFSPPGLLWSGGTMLLLGTVGVLATCKIALAILMGLGPIFILLALFDGTRGLFVGWLKGVVLLALAPLFAVLGGSLMLELAVPVLSSLLATPGQIDVRPAMAFFMIGAVHLALMFMVLKVATTMVTGWSVFGLARNSGADERGFDTTRAPAPAAAAPAIATTTARDRAAQSTPPPARDIRVTANTPLAANDTGGGPGHSRETRIVQGGPSAEQGRPGSTPVSRARGIGSRFKSAPLRSTEKI
ncbi:type IV secretion system protein [Aurantiacibacter poecillastricola]|uniref:type IV secretion system protein n=1 Tax=Aurantiacibacter poecillastricola TaxID=3064385 RepID=UPI00273D2F59|nr:type IV secretion system protein [Aurantiacibacter sp. 219JJ12-13]MDP5260043.1 type IV secretion system protein [Aurantiacibacter sp. 219JJ12-13]